jgi:hypothetical protein
LDYLKPNFALSQVSVEITNGVIAAIDLRYTNGLTSQLGTPGAGKKVSLNIDPYKNEKIVACSIETGRINEKSPFRITAFRLYTNRGPDLIGQADDWKLAVAGKGIRGGIEYQDLELKHFDPLLEGGYLKGVCGWCKYGISQTASTGIYRLGPIWGNATAATFVDASKTTSTDEGRGHEFLGGAWDTNSIHSWDKPTPTTSSVITFSTPYSAAPSIFFGMKTIDTFGGANMRFRAYCENVTRKDMTIAVDYFGSGSVFYQGKVSWMGVPVLDRDVLTGTFQSHGPFPFNRTIKFARELSAVPEVVIWLTGIDADLMNGTRINCHPTQVTTTGFTINIDCWATSKLYWASISWLAFTPDSGLASGVFAYTHGGDPSKQSQTGKITFPAGKFTKPPTLVSAFRHLDLNFATGKALPNPRIDQSTSEVTKDGATWGINTWGDSQLAYATSSWVAIPQL